MSALDASASPARSAAGGAALRAAWRAARSELPGAARRELLGWPPLLAAAAAFVGAWALTWALSSALSAPPYAPLGPPGQAGAGPAAIAVSFLLNLAILGMVLARLPLEAEAWGFGCVWLKGVLWTAAAVAGWRLAAGSGVSWACAAALAALTVAQAAALCGLAGLLAALFGRHVRAARLCLAVLVVLAVTGLFWSKPVLEALQRRSPPLYEAATQALVAAGPVTAVAALWAEQKPGFDLVRSRYTYEIWIGANLAYLPSLWPGQRVPAGAESGRARSAGLVLGLFFWGLLLVLASDYWNFLDRGRAFRPKGA